MRKTLLIFITLFSFELYAQEIIRFSDAQLEFHLTKKCDETDCEITKIEVLKNGTLKQTIKPGKNYFSKTFPHDQLFAIEDMNFDGNTDFRLMEFLPAAPNVPFLFWIFNPKTQLFEESKNYEGITSPEFDYEKKQISSSWRDGCCLHGRDVYELKNGNPVLAERFVIGQHSEDKEYYEHWKVENGELRLIVRKIY
ncbi:XAC2610-related protein [Salinimicrobium sp. GXAS 041]|uniref:XAC2610-related protein n=1 Tax=Salinimicrobium sp. GXAS 041 TaxID=3400806 RepID=UPI003C721932